MIAPHFTLLLPPSLFILFFVFNEAVELSWPETFLGKKNGEKTMGTVE